MNRSHGDSQNLRGVLFIKIEQESQNQRFPLATRKTSQHRSESHPIERRLLLKARFLRQRSATATNLIQRQVDRHPRYPRRSVRLYAAPSHKSPSNRLRSNVGRGFPIRENTLRGSKTTKKQLLVAVLETVHCPPTTLERSTRGYSP